MRNWPITILKPPKTRAERAFHLVERALLRTLLLPGSAIINFLPYERGTGEQFRLGVNLKVGTWCFASVLGFPSRIRNSASLPSNFFAA